MTLPSEWFQMFPGVRRQIVGDGEKAMLVRVEIEQAAVVPLHSHPHEQFTHVISGKLEFTIGEVTSLVGAGETAYMPSGVPHTVLGIETATVIDVFSPPREDFRGK